MKQYLQPLKIGDSLVVEEIGHKPIEYEIKKITNIYNEYGEEEITVKIKCKGVEL